MALRRLTSLEAGKLEAEAKELAARIAELQVRCTLGGAAAGWQWLCCGMALRSHVSAWQSERLVPAASLCKFICRSPCRAGYEPVVTNHIVIYLKRCHVDIDCQCTWVCRPIPLRVLSTRMRKHCSVLREARKCSVRMPALGWLVRPKRRRMHRPRLHPET